MTTPSSEPIGIERLLAAKDTRQEAEAEHALQDLAIAWDDYSLPPNQPPTPRPLPDSDTDSDSGHIDTSPAGFGPAELAEYSIPLPGTPMTPAVGPVHRKAGRWLQKKWKKSLMLGAYLGKEWKEQMAAFRYCSNDSWQWWFVCEYAYDRPGRCRSGQVMP